MFCQLPPYSSYYVFSSFSKCVKHCPKPWIYYYNVAIRKRQYYWFKSREWASFAVLCNSLEFCSYLIALNNSVGRLSEVQQPLCFLWREGCCVLVVLQTSIQQSAQTFSETHTFRDYLPAPIQALCQILSFSQYKAKSCSQFCQCYSPAVSRVIPESHWCKWVWYNL